MSVLVRPSSATQNLSGGASEAAEQTSNGKTLSKYWNPVCYISKTERAVVKSSERSLHFIFVREIIPSFGPAAENWPVSALLSSLTSGSGTKKGLKMAASLLFEWGKKKHTKKNKKPKLADLMQETRPSIIVLSPVRQLNRVRGAKHNPPRCQILLIFYFFFLSATRGACCKAARCSQGHGAKTGPRDTRQCAEM